MPFNIFGKHVEGQRGTLLEKVLPQKKDTEYPLQDPANRPPPKTNTTSLPRIKLSEITYSTQYASPKAVQRAAANVAEMTSQQQFRTAVQDHIRSELHKAHQKAQASGAPMDPVLIVVGEFHDSVASLTANLAAMGSVYALSGNAQPTLLVEGDAAKLAGLNQTASEIVQRLPGLRGKPADQTSAALDAMRTEFMAANKDFDWAAQILVALQAGFQVLPFDTFHSTATDLDHREQGMVTSIRQAVRNASAVGGGPVMVTVGNFHAPKLHQQLAGETTMVTIAGVSGEEVDTPIARKRNSYLIAHPGIMDFMSSIALEGEQADFVGMARQSGLPMG